MNNSFTHYIQSALFGVAIGDALGVPVEFTSREVLRRKPVADMMGYGTYNVQPGTFSDDSSLSFCLAEALTVEYDIDTIAHNFVQWYKHTYWTAHGHVFDIGIATRQAIERLANGARPDTAGGRDASSNGNGSLMRIVPLLFYSKDMPISRRFSLAQEVSSITHGHIRSVIACFYYLEFARLIIEQKDMFEIYATLQTTVTDFLLQQTIAPQEIAFFDRLLHHNIYELPEGDIFSSGYVLHTLEASIWCVMTTDNYKAAVLKAVNLGEDTDTTGAVTGGLAGLLYGLDNIPEHWIKQLARREDIHNLAERMSDYLLRGKRSESITSS